jgi:hypothetical protein
LADEDTNSESPHVVDHVKAAVAHAFEALRCFAAILTADAERRAHRVVGGAVWALGWFALGIVGVVFLAAGLAELINDAIGATKSPGLIRVFTGILILAVFGVIMLLKRARKEQA